MDKYINNFKYQNIHDFERARIIENLNNLADDLKCLSYDIDFGDELKNKFESLMSDVIKFKNLNLKQSELIKRTCQNCEYYHPTLTDMKDTNKYHFHDYCAVWQSKIPHDEIFLREGYEIGYDDIECGIAHCWCFKPRNDGKYTDNFQDMTNNVKGSDNDDED